MRKRGGESTRKIMKGNSKRKLGVDAVNKVKVIDEVIENKITDTEDLLLDSEGGGGYWHE